jgi:large subunit ribosomal protein L5
MGVKEHIIFPEIDYDKIAAPFGMDITIVTSARTDEQALALLTHMKMPFRKN